jgi:hypothetical protein
LNAKRLNPKRLNEVVRMACSGEADSYTDRAAKAAPGQVQRGNTAPQLCFPEAKSAFQLGAGTLICLLRKGSHVMRRILAASLVAICGLFAGLPARADWVPPVKGNDTGGIIAYSVATQADARQIAVDHCAQYGKVVKFLAVDPQYGGYISFSCRWVPYVAHEQRMPVKALY